MFLSIAPVMLLQSYSIILLIPNINLRYCVAPRCGIIRNRASKFEFIKECLQMSEICFLERGESNKM